MQAASTERAWTYRGRSWTRLGISIHQEVSRGHSSKSLKPCFQYSKKCWRAKTEGAFTKDWILNVGRIIMPIQNLMLTRNGVSWRVMLIKKTTNFDWCKEQLKSCLGNRRVREPYARWCERRTPLLAFARGGAVYSMSISFNFGLTLLSIAACL